MLWALALLGVLPAAFSMEDTVAAEEDSEDSDSDESADDSEPQGDLLDDAVSPIGGVSADPSDEPAQYEVTANGEATTLTDFSADDDTVIMHFPNEVDGIFTTQDYQDEQGAEAGISLQYTDGESVTQINFVGHSELPADRISISLVDELTGEQMLFALEADVEEQVITPIDPEAPEISTPADDPNAVPVSATDPEEPEVPNLPNGPATDPILPTSPAADEVITEHVLSDEGETLILPDDPFEDGDSAEITADSEEPTIATDDPLLTVTGGDGDDVVRTGDNAAIVNAGLGNDTLFAADGSAILNGEGGDDVLHGSDTETSNFFLSGGDGDDQILGRDADETLSGGAGADILSGGAGDDTLLMDQNDMVSGGEGEDVFVLENDSSSSSDQVVTITDFEVNTDLLQIVADADDFDSETADLRVELSEDGMSSHVLVNGDLVAVLQGAPAVTSSDVVFASS